MKKSILIVDRWARKLDEVFKVSCKEIFDEDLDIGTANCIQDGIKGLLVMKPDILVMGYRFNDGNPDDFARRAREFHPDIKILVCSGALYLPKEGELYDKVIAKMHVENLQEALKALAA